MLFCEQVFIQPFRHGQNVTSVRFCFFLKNELVYTDVLYEYVVIQPFR